MRPAGQDPGAPGARNGHSTALFADECQSFLDTVMAGFGQIGARDDPDFAAHIVFFIVVLAPGLVTCATLANFPITGPIAEGDSSRPASRSSYSCGE